MNTVLGVWAGPLRHEGAHTGPGFDTISSPGLQNTQKSYKHPFIPVGWGGIRVLQTQSLVLCGLVMSSL